MTEPAQELSYRDVAEILRSSWKLVLLLIFAGAVCGAGIAYWWTPVYRAQVLLAPLPVEPGYEGALSRLVGQFGGISGALGIGGGDGTATKSARLAALSSRMLTEQFIRERNLMPQLFPRLWDSAAGKWKGAAPTSEQAFLVFTRKIRSVAEDRRTSLVTLSIEWRDRAKVAEWANDLARRANQYLRQRAIDEAQRSIEFLEGELKKTIVVERQQIILRLIETKTGEIMMANARPDYAFAVVDPAVTPDADNFVRPRRLAVIFFGAFLGAVAGVLLATLRWLRGARPR